MIIPSSQLPATRTAASLQGDSTGGHQTSPQQDEMRIVK
jgi:hypothetical protein